MISTVIAIARKYKASIATGDKDLAYVASKLGIAYSMVNSAPSSQVQRALESGTVHNADADKNTSDAPRSHLVESRMMPDNLADGMQQASPRISSTISTAALTAP